MRSPTSPTTNTQALGTRDADSLFRTKPISEIRAIESSTRREIGAKKEELRQLVGSRYRDLFESADSILLMAKSCQSIAANLSSISDAVRSLSSATSDDPRRPPADPARARVHSLASRVKYLVDTPENIWGCLDEPMLLEAAGRYLRAKVVHGLIGSDREVLAKFPILRHQWQIVESFRLQISQRSRERLSEKGLGVGGYADALAAISTIDEVDPKQILGLFLDSRRMWISQMLAGSFGNVDYSSEVLISVMRLIRDSLGQVGELFVLALSEMPLFYKIVLGSPPGSQVFGGIHNPEEEVRLWRLHREKLESVMVLMEPEYIAQTCSSWLRSCCDEIFGQLGGGERLIDAIVSGEGLGSAEKLVREALDSREDLDESLDQWLKSVFGSDTESPWNQIRRFILKDGMDIFEDRLEEALVGRMKKIVHTEFENLSKDIQSMKAIEATLGEERKADDNQFEAYLRKPYNGGGVWFSDPNQKKTTLLYAFKPTIEDTDFQSCINAYFGPEVGRIRDAVDTKCQTILEDILCFVECHNSTLRLKELAPYLQENCYSTISLLVRELEDELESLSASLENHVSDKNSLPPSVIVERSLFTGRLLYALGNHSSYIPLILGSPRQWVKDTSSSSMGSLLSSPSPRQPKMPFDSLVSSNSRRHSFDSPRSPKKQSSDTPRRQTISVAAALFSFDDSINRKLDELNKKLRELCIKAHSVWATWVANELSLILSKNLSRDETLSVSTALHGWEVTVVKQEESMEGPLEVTIALPSMPSLYVTSFLFQACLEIHKVGGHVLDKLIVQNFSWRLLQKVLDIYEKCLSSLEGGECQVSEKGILQILFDLRFITDILSGGKDSITSSLDEPARKDSSRFQALKPSFRRTLSQVQTDSSAHVESVTRLINRLSQQLDPIDWAMYETYLWENEKQSYKRYAVLFGFLVQLNRLYTDIAQKLPTKSNTGSNIMRCSVVPRFKYLPISAPVLSSRGVQKSGVHNLSDDTSTKSPWKAYSNGDHSPNAELDESTDFGVATPLLKSIMTVGSKFGESTSGWGSMLSDGQVGRFKDRSAAAMSTFGDILPGPAAGLFSSFTSGASRSNS